MSNTNKASASVATAIAASLYVKPSVLMAADPALRKLTVGQQISPKALGWAEHPTFGQLPDITVETILADGRLGTGIFTCQQPECSEEVRVHPGDWFQKRRCADCQAKHGGTGRNRKLSPEEKLARAEQRTQEREITKLQKDNQVYLDTLKKAGATPAQVAEAAAKQAALIAKVAAEKGVKVSPKAPKVNGPTATA